MMTSAERLQRFLAEESSSLEPKDARDQTNLVVVEYEDVVKRRGEDGRFSAAQPHAIRFLHL